MKNILVTGGAGFIGSNFVRFVLEHDPDVVIFNLDALTYAGSMANLEKLPAPERHIFIQGDICNPEFLKEVFVSKKIDTVVHFAAESHVDRSILGPGAFVQTNIIGTFNLLEAARFAWLQNDPKPAGTYRFHHVSTDEVFGSLSKEDHAFMETTPYSPNSPYSASKASSDHLVRAYYHTYGLPVTISNCSNNYGPYQFPEKLIPLMILNCMEGKPLPIYGDGQQIRDWLYVEDHCEAIWKIVTRGETGETYNIGGDNQPANLEIVQQICATMDERFPNSKFYPHSSLITYVKDRPGHDRRYAMDISKINAKLGWKPRYALADGLKKTIDWYIQNPDWVASIRKQNDYQTWMQKNYSGRGGETK